MKRLSLCLSLLPFLLSPAAHGAIYKCKDAKGNTVYSDTLCPTDATKVKVNISTFGGNSNESYQENKRVAAEEAAMSPAERARAKKAADQMRALDKKEEALLAERAAWKDKPAGPAEREAWFMALNEIRMAKRQLLLEANANGENQSWAIKQEQRLNASQNDPTLNAP